jgi:hypothetical protein
MRFIWRRIDPAKRMMAGGGGRGGRMNGGRMGGQGGRMAANRY